VKIICGLGNPGREYERHRHNIGFQVLNALATRWKASFTGNKFEAEVCNATFGGQKVLLLKPQTFMNVSGQSVASAAKFYKVGVEAVLVVHDELDLPFGRLQLKPGGGSGGHNGLKSIAESWGEQDYARLRFGIGRPPAPGPDRVVGHVLSAFSGEEHPQLPPMIAKAAEGCEAWIREGMSKAMNGFNRKA
jgi:peptidyl-tRNA hydrolase, PTH1 family